MAGSLFVNSLIFQITVCIVLINETSSYTELLLEDGKLCKLREDADHAVVKLGREEDSSQVVTQYKYFAAWTGRYNFKCSFQVKAPQDHGIYAVIQVLNFRKNESSCKDYVQFESLAPLPLFEKVFNFNRPKIISKRQFCGRIYASQSEYDDSSEEDDEDKKVDMIAPNSFKSTTNSMLVTIYVATDRLMAHEKLDIKIAFTAYKRECFFRNREDYIQCNRCEWIWKGLELDKIQNCPYVTCKDENFCKNMVRDVVSNGTGTKVTVGAVVTILLFFLMFAMCLWVCRRSQRCCWSPSSNNSSRMEMNRTRQHNMYEENNLPFGEMPPGPATPSAPPLTDVKDLPPSYDSLFPAK